MSVSRILSALQIGERRRLSI